MRSSPLWLLLLLLLVACGRDPVTLASPSTSPVSASPAAIASDPAVRRGRLANGLEYALMRSQQPPNKISLRLRIGSGSLQESDEQRGLAHYLEHLAFNGSERFPPGELVPRLQKAGLAFGAHTNAHTSFDETVYKLDLPDLAPETLALGLDVLADQAGRLLLLPGEIERERGVILAEMRDRDSPGYRLHVRQQQLLFAGTRVAERSPIGVAATVQAADATGMRDYYAAWYRPERMQLALVGDFDPEQVEAKVRAAFADLTAQIPARPEPALGQLIPGQVAAALHDPEAEGTDVLIAKVVQRSRPADTRASRQEQFLRDLAEQVLNRRVEARIQAHSDGPLQSGASFSYQWLDFYLSGMSGQAKPGQAVAALAVLVEEWRRMAEFGPTPAELTIAREAVQHELDRAVAQAATRANPGLADAIVQAAGDQQAFQSPEQARALGLAMLAEASPASVQAAFAAGWDQSPGRSIALVSGHQDLGPAGDRVVNDAFQAAWTRPVAAPVAKARVAWGYDAPAVWAGQISAPATGALCWSGVYNGISIQAKRTDFQPNQVLLRVRLALRTEPRPPALAGLLSSAFLAGGLGKHSLSELNEILAGSSIQPVGPTISDDGVTFGMSCLPGELERACALLRVCLLDPGWRIEAEMRSKTAWLDQLAAEPTNLDASLARLQLERLYPDQPWRQAATVAQVKAQDFASARPWFEPILRHAPLGVSLVGDIDPPQAMAIAARYFGGGDRPLPRSFADPTAARAALPSVSPISAGEHRLEVPGSASRAVIIAMFPTADIYDISRSRRLNLLAAAVTERLRERLRQELGQAYSPYAQQMSGEAWRDEGRLEVQASVAPDQVESALIALRAIAADLRQHGVSPELLARVKEPLVRNLAGYRRQNGYWLGILDRAVEQPFRLDWAQAVEQDYAAITAAELSALAATYVDPAKALVVIGICHGGGR